MIRKLNMMCRMVFYGAEFVISKSCALLNEIFYKVRNSQMESFSFLRKEINRIGMKTIIGITEEELDFIINYDIKYRMGDELGGEE